VCLGVADLITDVLAYARLQSGEIVIPNELYHAAYAVVLCFGVVTTVLSLGYRLRNARLMRAYVLELGKHDHKASVSAARKQAQQHEWELAQTHRTKIIASLALLSIVAQGACGVTHEARVMCMRWARQHLQDCRCPSSTVASSFSTMAPPPTGWCCAHFPCCTKRGKL
jgi:hypothetical protein